jgi:hypothetical protein
VVVTSTDVFDPMRDSFTGRGLSEWMLVQFLDTDGLLNPVLRAVLSDPDQALELEIRRHYVNIYYRGANLMEVRQPNVRSPRLTGRFDKGWIQKYAETPWREPATTAEVAVHEWLDAHEMLGSHTLAERHVVERHVASFAFRRRAMDANMKRRFKPERDAQQKMVLANSSMGSEYLICDIEYSFAHERRGAAGRIKTSRLDALAVHHPKGNGRATPRMALIELKHGVHAIDGVAGLREHVNDIGRRLEEQGNLDAICADIVRITQQKHRLGILSAPIKALDTDREVDYIVAVAEHNPRSQVLCDALLGRKGLADGRLAPPRGLSVKIALLDDSLMLRHDEFIPIEAITDDNIPTQIFCRERRDRRWRKGEMLGEDAGRALA